MLPYGAMLQVWHWTIAGKSNSEHNLVIEDDDEFTFGWKFIGVFPGATLELHGKKKTAWTKLAQTVKPVKDTECALVYDHADTTVCQGPDRAETILAWFIEEKKNPWANS